MNLVELVQGLIVTRNVGLDNAPSEQNTFSEKNALSARPPPRACS